VADTITENELNEFTNRAINWNLNAQWTKSRLKGFIPKVTFPKFSYFPYPEITGYGVSLFSKLFKKTNNKTFFERAVLAANALATLQLPSGGFVSAISETSSPVITFDHIVITNAMLDYYELSHDEKYLESARKALHFLISHQKNDGQIPGKIGTDAPADAYFHTAKAIIPFLKMYRETSEHNYFKAAEKLAIFTITEFQKEDGGFRVNLNDSYYNRFHFHCYALEGLTAFESLNSFFTENTEAGGVYLLNNQRSDGAIWYSFSNIGNPITEKVDLSATVQSARILLFLFNRTHKKQYQDGAIKALKYVTNKQHVTRYKLTNGGLPFGYHNLIDSVCVCSWATQFAADLPLTPNGGFGVNF
jgi:rhamnogalacturonyl hydrolase YesR